MGRFGEMWRTAGAGHEEAAVVAVAVVVEVIREVLAVGVRRVAVFLGREERGGDHAPHATRAVHLRRVREGDRGRARVRARGRGRGKARVRASAVHREGFERVIDLNRNPHPTPNPTPIRGVTAKASSGSSILSLRIMHDAAWYLGRGGGKGRLPG